MSNPKKPFDKPPGGKRPPKENPAKKRVPEKEAQAPPAHAHSHHLTAQDILFLMRLAAREEAGSATASGPGSLLGFSLGDPDRHLDEAIVQGLLAMPELEGRGGRVLLHLLEICPGCYESCGDILDLVTTGELKPDFDAEQLERARAFRAAKAKLPPD